jgi:hypothetical protein
MGIKIKFEKNNVVWLKKTVNINVIYTYNINQITYLWE